MQALTNDIDTDDETGTENTWRPPLWRDGLDYRDEPWTPEEVSATVKKLKADKYLTDRRKLTEKAHEVAKKFGTNSDKYREIVDAAHNENELRDAWNTPKKGWILAEKFLPASTHFAVDPMWNPGTEGLPGLKRTLDGATPERDGYAIDESRNAAVLADLIKRGHASPDTTTLPAGEGFPLHWRGDLGKGKAAAAVNGRHSGTKRWLALCDAYGQEEFCAAFVPYGGDRWLWEIGYRCTIVFHLGRAHCGAPPGIKSSSPRGPSIMLLWIPPAWCEGKKLARLPEHTQRVIAGEQIIVPYHNNRTVLVGPGKVSTVIDIGMRSIEGRA